MMQEYWDPIRARLSVEDAGGAFAVRADLRGLVVEELRVRVHEDTVTISGASSAEGEQRPFCHTLRLSSPVRSDQSIGGFADGILNLTLPQAIGIRPSQPATPAPVLPGRAAERRILVIDDDDEIRDSLRMTLSDEGYEVVAAPHGAAALDLVRTSQPQAILLDMWMPVMDGWDFSRAYRELPGPHAPIIAVTAARDAAKRAAQIDADGYLAKPFDLSEMLALVDRHARAN